MFVPTINNQGIPAMPTTPQRARRLICSKSATPFWSHGIFCIRLNVDVQDNKQDIAIGIDTGSKKEGFSVCSKKHTYLNIQADALTYVKAKVETRRMLRRSRRSRNTPYRKCRWNRKIGRLPPSTKARWDWKLRIVNILRRVIPLTHSCVEDIKAKAKKRKRKWNISFSPIEVGKKYFYNALDSTLKLKVIGGTKTAKLRKEAGLKKNKKKLSEKFETHCVDAFVLACHIIWRPIIPDNKVILCVSPIELKRRMLHAMVPSKGGTRRKYGGTRSLGLKRGSLVKHKKHGICYVGGTMKNRISLHNLNTGKRLCRNAKPEECKKLTFNTWRRHSYNG